MDVHCGQKDDKILLNQTQDAAPLAHKTALHCRTSDLALCIFLIPQTLTLHFSSMILSMTYFQDVLGLIQHYNTDRPT